MEGPTRNARARRWLSMNWPWVVATVLVLALHLTAISDELGGNLGGDNAEYFLLSLSLADSCDYANLYLPDEPPHVKFPPVFPLILAPWHLVEGNPLLYMHATVAVFAALAALGFGVWAARLLDSKWIGVGVVLAAGTIPKIYIQSLHLLSEPVYMAFVAFSLAAVERSRESDELAGRGFALVAILAGLALFTRSAGLALAAVCIDLAVNGKRVSAGKFRPRAWRLMAAVLGGLLLAWVFRNHLVAAEGAGYLDQLLMKDPYNLELGRAGAYDLARRAFDNLSYFVVLGAHGVSPVWMLPLPMLVTWSLSLFVLGIMAIGAVAEVRSRRPSGPLFLVFSMLILVLWPFWEERFVVPLLPVGLVLFLRGAGVVFRMIPREGAERIGLVATLALILAMQGLSLVRLVSLRFADGRMPAEPVYVTGYGKWSEPVVNWARYEIEERMLDDKKEGPLALYTDYVLVNLVAGFVTDEDDVILSRKPMLTYLFSGRKSVPILPVGSAEAQWESMADRGVDYVVTGMEEVRLEELRRERPERFRIRARSEYAGAALFKVVYDEENGR